LTLIFYKDSSSEEKGYFQFENMLEKTEIVRNNIHYNILCNKTTSKSLRIPEKM